MISLTSSLISISVKERRGKYLKHDFLKKKYMVFVLNKKAWYNTFTSNTVNTHSKNQKNFFVKISLKKFHAFHTQI